MLGRTLNLLVLLVVVGLGLTTAMFRANTLKKDRGTRASPGLAIRAYNQSDQKHSDRLITELKSHLQQPYTWMADPSLSAASWSILRYTEGLSSARVDGVVPEAMEGAIVTDPLVIPIEIQGDTEDHLIARLASVLTNDLDTLHFNRLGLAAEEHQGTWRLTCLVTLRRLEILNRIPHVTSEKFLTLRGRILQPARSAEILVLYPGGLVGSTTVPIHNGEFQTKVELIGDGRHKVEIVLWNHPARPQPPAALFSIQAGTAVQNTTAMQPPQFRLLPFGNLKRATREFTNSIRTWTDRLRLKNGLPELNPDQRLDLLAQRHAEDLAERRTLSHLDRTGRNPEQRMQSVGLQAISSGENVAAGLTIEAIKTSLENSPSHRRGMLRGDVRNHGVGIAERDGVLFVVQLFASE